MPEKMLHYKIFIYHDVKRIKKSFFFWRIG